MSNSAEAAYLSVRLKWSARVTIDVCYATFWVTRQVDALFHFDLGHFLVDLCLLFSFSFLDEWHQFAGDGGNFVKETKLLLVESLSISGKRSDDQINHSFKNFFIWISLLS